MVKTSGYISIFIAVLVFTLTFSSKVSAFSDVYVGVDQKEAIDYVFNQGIVNGYSDGTYRPYDKINRADFTKITVSAFFKNQIDNNAANCFGDVKTEYFAKYVCVAKNFGVVHGYTDLLFHPEANINLAEALKILLESKKVQVPEVSNGLWYHKYLLYSEQNGILHNISSHNWDHFVTRGEMARLIFNLLGGGAVVSQPPVNNPPPVVNNPPPVNNPPADSGTPPAPTPALVFNAKYNGLKQQIEAILVQNKVPGASVAFVVGDKIEWADGIGVTDSVTKKPVTVDTMFQAASISKPLTAMAALRLVEQNKLSLNAIIDPYLKSTKIPGSDKITLRQLLSHTAGTNIHGFIGYAPGAPLPTLQQILLGLAPANTPAIKVVSAIGSFVYSGGGYVVVQQMLIDAYNKSFPDLMNELVLAPLHMEHSTYAQPLSSKYLSLAASGHDVSMKVYPGGWTVLPEMAADGLWSTPLDLAKFGMYIQKANAGKANDLLSLTMVKDMLTLQSPGGIGLGLFVDATSFFHGGVNPGYKNSFFASKLLAPGNIFIVMTNSDNGQAVFKPINDAVMAAYNKK